MIKDLSKLVSELTIPKILASFCQLLSFPKQVEGEDDE